MNSIIIGTGSYIPTKKVCNEDFLENAFYDPDGTPLAKDNREIIEQFEKITEIKERRHVSADLATSDIAFFAAQDALASSKADREELDYIIVAHNFGDVKDASKQTDFVPNIAARVKHKLKIRNPQTIAYDLPFGCPGWLQGMIQADYFLKSGDARRALVIGAETLSRISDPHDRDSMIYSDGAGAAILESVDSAEPVGILAHSAQTDALDQAFMLQMDRSYNPGRRDDELFLKMNGRRVYEYALKQVPQLVKKTIEKAGLLIDDVRKVLLHQANAKMDAAILDRLYRLFGRKAAPPGVMPMIISWLGNNSVASVPTLLDLLLKGRLGSHNLNRRDVILMASVGAGMNINAIAYRMP
jgi:3-oxoacyl-[acyl-carrier-protein] synthase-3